MKKKAARGKLIIIGGAENKDGECAILKEFVRLAGGAKARLVVLTVATNLPEEVGDEYTKVFRQLGVDEVSVVDVSERQDASAEDALQLLERASGVFFTGGNQLHITSLLGGSPLLGLLQEKHEAGLTIAGTSAGAAMMSNSMILRGDADAPPRCGVVEIGPGLDFVPGSIIDTHFSQRGRFGRLLTAVAHFPQNLGFGIDENTAMVVDAEELRVIGEHTITVFDASAITYTNLPYLKQDDSLTLHGVVVHTLGEGHKFDLAKRQPVSEAPGDSRPKRKAKANKA